MVLFLKKYQSSDQNRAGDGDGGDGDGAHSENDREGLITKQV